VTATLPQSAGGWDHRPGQGLRDGDNSSKWTTSGINRRCGQSARRGKTTRILFPTCSVSRLGRECAYTPPLRRLQATDPCYMLNRMVQCQQPNLDVSFAALSDSTRRGILERLGRADASITDLAQKFHMTLTGMKKHVGVLEQAGLVTTEKVGRVRTCKLGLRCLEEEAAWIERHRRLWDARFDELDKIVAELKLEKVDGRKMRK